MSFIRRLWNIGRRSIHYKENPKNYPDIHINDVILDKPRYGFRRQRPLLLSESVRDTLFVTERIKEIYEKEGKPVPIKYRSDSDAIARRNYEKYQEEVATGQPHFKLGEKRIFLPKARICLLRPNAKHTPYQAKFLVPRNFNKMDLRDYLWHVYGLRALNVTVQLLHARFTRGPDDHARYRGPQYKKMTIDMEEPFFWPEVPDSIVKQAEDQQENQIKALSSRNSYGSDKQKSSDAFDGLYKKPTLPDSFIPSRAREEGEMRIRKLKQRNESKSEREMVSEFLGL